MDQAAADPQESRAARLLKDAKARWSAREAHLDPIFDGINAVIMPRKPELLAPDNVPDVDKEKALFDITASRANQVAAAGQMSWMSPADSSWFSVDPGRQQRHSDPVKRWLSECSDILREHLAASGTAYHSLHSSYLNAGALGTYAVTVDPDGLGSFHCTAPDTGTYSISENERGEIDIVDRKLRLSPRQIAAKFSNPLDDVPEKIHVKLAQGGESAEEKLDVWHLTFPRPDAPQIADRMGTEMPIASVYILECEGAHILREGGSEEMSIMVGQWLKPSSETPYGWGPGWLSYPEARQLNVLQKYADTLAELAAYPRVLAPSSMAPADFDFRAYGITYFDASKPTDAQPRPWLTESSNSQLQERIAAKQGKIEDAFMLDMFQLFSGLDRDITAYEASQLQAERLIQFSPTFALRTTQLFTPFLKRCFWILYRAGAFPEPPDEAYLPLPDGRTAVLPEPHIEFSSRMVLSMKAMKNTALQRVLGTLDPLAQANPAVLDNFDFDTIARDSALNEGLPAPWMRSKASTEDLRQERAQILAAQAAQAAADPTAAPALPV